MPDGGRWVEEFLFGGLSTCIACVFSNPFDVAKTRMQLQGERQAFGTYERHYRNVFHSLATIARVEGWSGLQRGLGPGMVYAFVMNGVRLGTYQSLTNVGWTTDPSTGKPSFGRAVLAGALAGGLGGAVASPLYLVKTHLQSQSMKEIAVGHQYRYRGTLHGLREVYSAHGLRGLWRGVGGAVPRLTLGSALQLSTFTRIKEHVRRWAWVSPAMLPVVASMASSVNIVIFMEPFDVVRTRLYNQPVDAQGRGLYYRGFVHCFSQIAKTEGLWAFYKGAGAAYFRMAPQAVFGLSIWDNMRRLLLDKVHSAPP